MRVSELSRLSAVPVPTIKYYLREGLLPAGEQRGATQADYGDTHVARLRLIRSLADVAGLSIIMIKRILTLAESPSGDLFDTLGQAISALPPYVPGSSDDPGRELPRARDAITRLGWTYDPGYAATAQLERAIAAVEEAGIPLSDQRLEAYATALHGLAEFDLAAMPGADGASSIPAAAVEYAVLGTALYEPVILALRRLAHQDVAARALGGRSADPDPSTTRLSAG